MNFSDAPVTMILIALNVAISLIGFSNANFVNRFIFWPYGIARNNDYLRFLSSGFLHADFMHLFFNMFTLYFFGRNLEIIFTQIFPMGQLWYILLYIVGMIVADLPSYSKNINNAHFRSLGASGAVAAVVFGAIFFDPWNQIALYGFIKMSALLFAVAYIAYCVYMSKNGQDNINHDAHLWGSLFGIAMTALLVFMLRPDILPNILEELKNPSLLGR